MGAGLLLAKKNLLRGLCETGEAPPGIPGEDAALVGTVSGRIHYMKS
jgi:hypothetical protein